MVSPAVTKPRTAAAVAIGLALVPSLGGRYEIYLVTEILMSLVIILIAWRLVLGTAEGLETDLVPAAGYELVTIDKVPFPRRPDLAAISEQFVSVAPGKTEDGPGWLTHPVDTDRLRDYWTKGEGAAKIAEMLHDSSVRDAMARRTMRGRVE